VIAVGEGAGIGVAEAVSVGKGVRLGRGVRLGANVSVGSGVKLSTMGWNGVGVALAFGSTVTRLRGGEEAGGSAEGSVQEARNIKTQSTLIARSVRRVMLVRVREVGCDQV
jgi:hypothetical protein